MCHVWESSTHVSKLDPALNEAYHSITGCLTPTSVENVYLLAAVALPGVRRATTSRQERRTQPEDPRHSLYCHEPGGYWNADFYVLIHSIQLYFLSFVLRNI